MTTNQDFFHYRLIDVDENRVLCTGSYGYCEDAATTIEFDPSRTLQIQFRSDASTEWTDCL